MLEAELSRAQSQAPSASDWYGSLKKRDLADWVELSKRMREHKGYSVIQPFELRLRRAHLRACAGLAPASRPGFIVLSSHGEWHILVEEVRRRRNALVEADRCRIEELRRIEAEREAAALAAAQECHSGGKSPQGPVQDEASDIAGSDADADVEADESEEEGAQLGVESSIVVEYQSIAEVRTGEYLSELNSRAS